MMIRGNSGAADELRSFRDRWVRLEKERLDLKADIDEVKAQAKARGFDVKSLGATVKRTLESALDAAKRRETEAITDLYCTALGINDGEPLSDAARRRLMDEQDQTDDAPGSPGDDDEPARDPATQYGSVAGDDGAEPAAPAGAITPEDIAAARDTGAAAVREGARIIDNPYTAGDPRRAAWDEGWCAAAGSDGMDIPEAWRRRKPKKAGDAAPGDGAADQDQQREDGEA